MNQITLKHPTTNETRTTKDFSTARNLLMTGWQIVPTRANVKQVAK